MSPEQVLGKPLDYRSDLWQVAMIVFECVTGQRAFSGTTLGEVFMRICTAPLPVPSQIAHVPVGFDAWFARAAQRDPNARFQSIRELVDTLGQVLLRSGPGGPATVPLGATVEAEILDPPANGAAWSSGSGAKPNSARRALTIALVVLPIFAAGIIAAIWIVSSHSGGPTPETSASPGSPIAPSANVPQQPTANGARPPVNDVEDAGPPSMQNVPDAGKSPRHVTKKKDNDLGF